MRPLVRTRWATILVLVSLLLPSSPLWTSTALAVIGPCTPSFSQPSGSPFAAGDQPSMMALGRFNGDSFPDLAVANRGSDKVTILLGNGSGGFTPAPGSPVAVGDDPSSVAVGRFNADTLDDLVVGNNNSQDLTILLGNGSGGFTPTVASPIPAGNFVTAVAVGRFNADAFTDIVDAKVDGYLSMLPGDGSGGFTPAATAAPVGGLQNSILVGRFNDDDLDDLAVSSVTNSTLTILLGDASGEFTLPSDPGVPLGMFPLGVAAGRFNGDANVDLAVANVGSNTVSILLGNGEGGFTSAPGSPVAGVNAPRSIVMGHFNGDTLDDLAVTSQQDLTVTILLGNGSGGFTPAPGPPAAVGPSPLSIVTARFNGDALDDLAVLNEGSNTVSILLNTCALADLGVTVAVTPEQTLRNTDLTYTLTVQNAGPDPAPNATLSVPLPAGTTFVSLSKPNGWTCTTPPVGASAAVSCSAGTMPVGSGTFTLVAHVGSGVAAPITLSNTVTIEAPIGDPSGANNSATANTKVVAVCGPRPNVGVATTPAGAGRLQVTITPRFEPATPANRLTEIRATIPANARLDVPNGPSDLTGAQPVPIGDGTQPVVFFIRRTASGAVTVPVVVVDACGEWKTFVGGGATAF